MPIAKLKSFLDENQVKYVTIYHSPAFTAQEIAASAHVPGKELAKTVMVVIDGRMAMAVLPASFQVELGLLKETTGADTVELAREDDFRDLFPDCEVGAMPPFGSLYGMETYVADKLAEDEEIVFNAGNHTELLRLAYEDYEKLVQPKVLTFAARV